MAEAVKDAPRRRVGARPRLARGQVGRAGAGAVRGFPTHDALTAVSPDNPVVLERADGHAVLANARAMASKGITRATKAPAGGEVIRNAAGEATGVFVDNAEGLVAPPERSPEEVGRALEPRDGRVSREGRHEPHRRRRRHRRHRALPGGGRRREAAHAPLRDGRGPADDAGARPAGPRERDAGRPHGEARARTERSARAALRSSSPTPTTPGNAGCSSRPPRIPGGGAARSRARIPDGHPPHRRPRQPDGARRLRDGCSPSVPRRDAAPPHRARADPRRRRHPALRDRLGVLRRDAGDRTAPRTCPGPGSGSGSDAAAGAYAWRKLLDTPGPVILNGTDAPVEDVAPLLGISTPTVTRQDAHGQPPGGFDPEQKLTREEALRYQKIFTMDEIKASNRWPSHCACSRSATSDGAGAVIVTTMENAKKYTKKPLTLRPSRSARRRLATRPSA